MALFDWVVVAVSLIGVMVVGFLFTRRASSSVADFFVGGRSIPWWLAGTSILATSFAADTPLHTTRMIREHGLGAGSFYWVGIIGGVIVALVFSQLWRRTGVVTENEFVELRYSGKPAAWLRGVMAIYKSFLLEIITMAWVTLGMVKVVEVAMGLPDQVSLLGATVSSEVLVVIVLIAVTVAFSAASGLWGVVTTDFIEFIIAMGGAVVLAVIAFDRVGGASGLREALATTPHGASALDMTPNPAAHGLAMFSIVVYFTVQWWANAYVDGSGPRAQRFLSSKDERHALASGLWSLSVQFVIRTWPWFIAALASMVLYPTLKDHEAAYPQMIVDLLPVGLKGLMIASFFSAFISTMDTHYNMTASYLVNDVYRRFAVKGRTEQHYVAASRWMTILVAVIAGVLALGLPSVLGALRFKMELMAGLGLIYVLRWAWWRINATTELAALVTSVLAAFAVQVLPFASGDTADASALRLVLVVAASAVVAIAATLLTRPEPEAQLVAFYRRVRPFGWWGPVARAAGGRLQSGFGPATLIQIALCMVILIAAVAGLGKILLGEPRLGIAVVAVAVAAGYLTTRWVFRTHARSDGAR